MDLAASTFGSEVNVAVNCAGIGVAQKTLGKKGAHGLADFEKCLSINAVGTFNVIRLSAERMSKVDPVRYFFFSIRFTYTRKHTYSLMRTVLADVS